MSISSIEMAMKLRFMDYLLTTLFPNEFQSPVWIANSDCSEHLLPKFCELNGSVKWLSILASSIGKLSRYYRKPTSSSIIGFGLICSLKKQCEMEIWMKWRYWICIVDILTLLKNCLGVISECRRCRVSVNFAKSIDLACSWYFAIVRWINCLFA